MPMHFALSTIIHRPNATGASLPHFLGMSKCNHPKVARLVLGRAAMIEASDVARELFGVSGRSERCAWRTIPLRIRAKLGSTAAKQA